MKIQEMCKIPYAWVVGSLVYALIYTRKDIKFIVGMLNIY